MACWEVLPEELQQHVLSTTLYMAYSSMMVQAGQEESVSSLLPPSSASSSGGKEAAASLAQVALNLALTCRDWHRLVHDETLWLRLMATTFPHVPREWWLEFDGDRCRAVLLPIPAFARRLVSCAETRDQERMLINNMECIDDVEASSQDRGDELPIHTLYPAFEGLHKGPRFVFSHACYWCSKHDTEDSKEYLLYHFKTDVVLFGLNLSFYKQAGTVYGAKAISVSFGWTRDEAVQETETFRCQNIKELQSLTWDRPRLVLRGGVVRVNLIGKTGNETGCADGWCTTVHQIQFTGFATHTWSRSDPLFPWL